MKLSTLAGWNQTAADWQLLLNLEPECCLALEFEQQLVATTTLVCYGNQLAYLGMVLTHPDFRRRGFARQLVERALKIAGARGIHCIKLDATEQGRPLYESVGFRCEQAIERWSRPDNVVASAIPAMPGPSPDFELDREAYGVDRGRLLQLFAESGRVFTTGGGFAMWRPGAHASLVGPCIARSPETARLLIERCISSRDGAWFWDLLPANREAVRIAADLGFQPERKLVRMVKGNNVRGQESILYAGGGFEFG